MFLQFRCAIRAEARRGPAIETSCLIWRRRNSGSGQARYRFTHRVV